MKKFIKYIIIILLCVFVDIFLHFLTSPYSTIPLESPNYSVLVRLLGIEISATLWALIAFSSVAYVFQKFYKRIPGYGFEKGLRYGSAIALLWLVAMLEGVSLFGNSIVNEFVVGLSDSIPVLLMGILLGLIIVKKGEYTKYSLISIRDKILIICSFSLVFFLGRYASYITGTVKSGFETYPTFTFLWTLSMGACIGLVCILLGLMKETSELVRNSLDFGLIIFGVNWLVFLVFMPLLFNGFMVDFLLRVTIDIMVVTIGYYLLMFTVFSKNNRPKLK